MNTSGERVQFSKKIIGIMFDARLPGAWLGYFFQFEVMNGRPAERGSSLSASKKRQQDSARRGRLFGPGLSDSSLPFTKRSDELAIRIFVEQGNEFDRVPVRISKVELGRWHPSNHGRFRGFCLRETVGSYFEPVEAFASR